MDRLKTKGPHLYAIEQPVDTSTATGKAFFDMLGVFAEFENNLCCERQVDCIAAAKNKGIYKGRPPSINQDKVKQLIALESSITPSSLGYSTTPIENKL